MGPSRLCLEVWILFRVQQEALGGSEQSSGYLIYLLNPSGFCVNGGGRKEARMDAGRPTIEGYHWRFPDEKRWWFRLEWWQWNGEKWTVWEMFGRSS